MDNERVGEGAPLGLKDPRHSHWIEGVTRKTVDRFRGKPDDPSSPKDLHGCGDSLLSCQNLGTNAQKGET